MATHKKNYVYVTLSPFKTLNELYIGRCRLRKLFETVVPQYRFGKHGNTLSNNRVCKKSDSEVHDASSDKALIKKLSVLISRPPF